MIDEETLRLKFRNKIYLPLTRKWRRRKIQFTDFTIISNNCWGGTVYESYGIKKMSPTVGMFIMPEDYLKFVSNLDYYLSQELIFVEPDESKWKVELGNKGNWGTYLIGKLDDIELQMLHYHDKEMALSKWKSRVKRVNKNRLIFKFNDQNGATKEQIEKFTTLPLDNKLCFVSKKEYRELKDTKFIIQPHKYEGEGIKASREPFGKSKYIDMSEYINSIGK